MAKGTLRVNGVLIAGDVHKIVQESGAGSGGGTGVGDEILLETGFHILTEVSATAAIQAQTGDNIVIREDDGSAVLTVDTSGVATFTGNVNVGTDDEGHDVKFYGATAGSKLTWDESADALLLTDSSPIHIGDSADMKLYHDGSNSYITNAVGALKVATETSGIAVTIGHTTSHVTVGDNLTVTGTSALDGVVSTASHIDMPDSANIKLGGSDDFQLYHDGTNSYITNATGALKIATETSGIAVTIGHTTSSVVIADNATVIGAFSAVGGAVFNEDTAAMDFRIESDDDTHMFFVDGSEDKIGIGTSAPDNLLHLNGTTDPQLKISGSATHSLTYGHGGHMQLTTTTPVGDGNVYRWSRNSGSGMAEQMRIDTSGNVGIGIAIPTHKLHVAQATTISTYDANARFVTNNFSTIELGHSSGYSHIVSNNGFHFHTNSNLGTIGSAIPSNIQMSITTAGMVGIDATPTETLSLGTTGTSGNVVTYLRAGDGGYANVSLQGGEGKAGYLYLRDDDADDAADRWLINNDVGTGNQNSHMYFTDYGQSSWDNQMGILNTGNVTCDGSFTGGGADYAEYFEWKEELADEAAAKALYGKTVVLEDDKVRLAKSGEESKVLGVVRPDNNSAMIGNSSFMKWDKKYLRDAYGESIMENYTQVKWYEYDADGNETKKHVYAKDRIPEYVVKGHDPCNDITDTLDASEPDWHLLESNFKLDKDGKKTLLKVPTTTAEKTAANYVEWSVYKAGKMEGLIDIGGTPLKRKKINPDYVSTKSYVPRENRPTEWVIIGLLGQIPVSSSTVIPTSWIKMKNIESGVDLYFVK